MLLDTHLEQISRWYNSTNVSRNGHEVGKSLSTELQNNQLPVSSCSFKAKWWNNGFLTDYCVVNMFFKCFFCPSAGVLCLTQLGSPPLCAPCSWLTHSVDFDGHGASFGLTNKWITDFPLLLCAQGKQASYTHWGVGLSSLSQRWPSGQLDLRDLSPLARLFPSPMAFASAVLHSVFPI